MAAFSSVQSRQKSYFYEYVGKNFIVVHVFRCGLACVYYCAEDACFKEWPSTFLNDFYLSTQQ